ncbi:YkgJ family cysteine cluster protein [Candidatus Sulfurimonas marisnigri]|uniref:YkgJ family cysteine cluster protein n=1 Tax=Candidatus Sulfurimonas marisnigri TaxID=2740405 RepID=A0A7S7RRF5_9BACT|nr:YkgJ family cysteine cluster protein [Candidatus Sulfurimonas marisnigri]QOY55500.1 YkgJ family cysteine cluster protein [Candidatus Sulfurimonas marisnigri]
MSNIVKKDGYSYSFDANACSTCKGKCCTGESGYIYVTKAEIESISKLLNLDIKDFVQEYLFKKLYKYSIKEKKFGENYECIFYDRESNGCNIYDARPLQCRTFPFWDYFKQRVDELKLECPGVIDV